MPFSKGKNKPCLSSDVDVVADVDCARGEGEVLVPLPPHQPRGPVQVDEDLVVVLAEGHDPARHGVAAAPVEVADVVVGAALHGAAHEQDRRPVHPAVHCVHQTVPVVRVHLQATETCFQLRLDYGSTNNEKPAFYILDDLDLDQNVWFGYRRAKRGK